MIRKRAIFAADIRRLGGVVTVQSSRSRTEAEEFLVVSHISRGGDLAFHSAPIHDPDQADAAARVLAEFTGAAMQSAGWLGRMANSQGNHMMDDAPAIGRAHARRGWGFKT